MRKDTDLFKPGMKVPKSGQYSVYDPIKGNTGFEITAVKGEPFPPTMLPGRYYKLTDPTKHKK